MSSRHILILIVTLGICSSCSQSTTNPVPAPALKQPAEIKLPPSRDIAGIRIGQAANLQECEKEKTYGRIDYKSFPSNVPCWAHTIYEREGLSLGSKGKMPKDGTLQVELGTKNVPEGVLNSAEVKVIDGKIEQIELTTFGSSYETGILELLRQKWGKPNISNVQELQNGFGAKYHGIEAQWLFGDFTVAFFGVMTKPDEGVIIIRSAVAFSKERAQAPEHAASF